MTKSGGNISIATTTYYPEWHVQDARDVSTVEQVRGDLALKTIACGLAEGYPVTVVDGGSSGDFMDAMCATGADVRFEAREDTSMSASRRKAISLAGSCVGAEAICWTEPEKISFVRDCLSIAAQPVLDGQADIVVPQRTPQGFASYPRYQSASENNSNAMWNSLLRRHGLLADEAPDLDAWLGPRIIRNSPELTDLFMKRYRFKSQPQSGLDQETPELWPNATFLPLVTAIKEKKNVIGVEVPYINAPEQTALEANSPEMINKRAFQQATILKTTVHLLRYLENDPKARIEEF